MDEFFKAVSKAMGTPTVDAPPKPLTLTKEAKALARVDDVPALLEIAAAGFDMAEDGTDEGTDALDAAANALRTWCKHRGLPYECAKIFAKSMVLKKSPYPQMIPDTMARGRVAAGRLRSVAAFLERVMPHAKAIVAEAELKS